jgi:hypothetical protein
MLFERPVKSPVNTACATCNGIIHKSMRAPPGEVNDDDEQAMKRPRGPLKSSIVKRTIVVGGKKISISLEEGSGRRSGRS